MVNPKVTIFMVRPKEDFKKFVHSANHNVENTAEKFKIKLTVKSNDSGKEKLNLLWSDAVNKLLESLCMITAAMGVKRTPLLNTT